MMRRTVFALLLVTVAIALTLTTAQGPFDQSSFAFQQYTGYFGTVFASPAPMLVAAEGTFLLTRPGKHGADVDQWGDGLVRLRGALIQSGRDRMLEIEPGSIRAASGPPRVPPPIEHIGNFHLTGEIADGKCYLGVMNTARGKVHRDCAVRCLSGGAPPVFLVRNEAGTLNTLLLTGLGREILNYVAEPVRLSGELQREGSQLVLKADPSSLLRE